jgi:hypothetical protein
MRSSGCVPAVRSRPARRNGLQGSPRPFVSRRSQRSGISPQSPGAAAGDQEPWNQRPSQAVAEAARALRPTRTQADGRTKRLPATPCSG